MKQADSVKQVTHEIEEISMGVQTNTATTEGERGGQRDWRDRRWVLRDLLGRFRLKDNGEKQTAAERAEWKKDNGLYELICEYYESRILFGIFRYGDQISSVSQICASFPAGAEHGFGRSRKLEEKGYIVTEERKVARVAYRATEGGL